MATAFMKMAEKAGPDLMKQGLGILKENPRLTENAIDVAGEVAQSQATNNGQAEPSGVGTAAPSGDGSSSSGSGGETEVANNIMCKGFQEMFTKNLAKYNDHLFKSLAEYFNDKHTKMMLDKMLNKNMGEYIKSNQFSGIVESEIQRSVGAIIQSALKSELRNRENYKDICNGIDKIHKKRYGGGKTKIKTRNSAKKRRTVKRGGTLGSPLPPPIGI